jgi:hypothetical protein
VGIPVSGYCGPTLLWNFDEETGVLTISGSGDMYTYGIEEGLRSPWYPLEKEITEVVFKYGAEAIGPYAFAEQHTGQVTYSDTLTDIGPYAFAWNTCVEELVLPKNIVAIHDSAYYSGVLRSAYIPEGATEADIETMRRGGDEARDPHCAWTAGLQAAGISVSGFAKKCIAGSPHFYPPNLSKVLRLSRKNDKINYYAKLCASNGGY